MAFTVRIEECVHGGTPPEEMGMKDGNAWTVTLALGDERMDVPFFQGSAHTQPPVTGDVLSSLMVDKDVGEMSFEDFCADFGYDTDSRRAYATWEKCRELGAELEDFLGDALPAFIEAFEMDNDAWYELPEVTVG